MATATLRDCLSAASYAAQWIVESGFLHLMLFGGLLFSEDVDEEHGLEEGAVTCVLEGRPEVCGGLQVEGTDGGESADWALRAGPELGGRRSTAPCIASSKRLRV
ncbi:hypothetical protein PS2_014027 [Malus domestica]